MMLSKLKTFSILFIAFAVVAMFRSVYGLAITYSVMASHDLEINIYQQIIIPMIIPVVTLALSIICRKLVTGLDKELRGGDNKDGEW